MAGQIVDDDQAMALAIAEAEKGLATVGDNPAVGCVITSCEGKVLATGYHKVSGQDHAEVAALKNLPAGTDLTGCQLYVTLEPCAFEGRTGSCAKKIAALPVGRVIVGLKDPHPEVNGAGIKILKASGKEVVVYEKCQAELEKLIEVFSYGLAHKKTFVALKMATSLDGQIALVSGESQWITSEKAREHAHMVRSHHDAILIGRNTLQRDNPTLNIRYGDHQDKKLKIIVLDPRLQAAQELTESKLLKAHGAENVFLVTGKEASAAAKPALPKGIQNFSVDTLAGGQVDLDQLKVRLYEQGIRSLLVEGGAATYSAFFNQKAAQRVYQYIAMSYIGAGGGLASTVNMRLPRLAEQIRLKNIDVKKLEPDLLISGLIG